MNLLVFEGLLLQNLQQNRAFISCDETLSCMVAGKRAEDIRVHASVSEKVWRIA